MSRYASSKILLSYNRNLLSDILFVIFPFLISKYANSFNSIMIYHISVIITLIISDLTETFVLVNKNVNVIHYLNKYLHTTHYHSKALKYILKYLKLQSLNTMLDTFIYFSYGSTGWQLFSPRLLFFLFK